ncbi:hypothetical protein ACFU6I_40385 [Streptomyces sp. NPDC057486]|uniref:hypothetical protein n=1 Tax=Streptomyces sp. NPDC057486 TaxID=3346145 RepID=UPI0036882B1E
MLKLDAPDPYFERGMTNHDYPGETTSGRLGPGWGWLYLPRPFGADFVQAQFTPRIFKRYRTCHSDLHAFVTEQLVRLDQPMAVAAGAALQENQAQEFVMICGARWAFASYEVPSGQRTSEAGTAFYNGWVSAMNSDPQTRSAVMFSRQPTIMVKG